MLVVQVAHYFDISSYEIYGYYSCWFFTVNVIFLFYILTVSANSTKDLSIKQCIDIIIENNSEILLILFRNWNICLLYNFLLKVHQKMQ